MNSSISHARPRYRRRSATTLVEVVGTLSVLLVLAISAVGILGSITQIGTRTNHAKQGRSSIERLAKVFRDDVHAASNVDPSQQDCLVELTTDAGTVRYEWDEDQHSLQRAVMDGEKRLAVDRFQLTDRCSPKVSVDGKWVTFVLASAVQHEGARGAGTPPWSIEAQAP